jgi:NADPH-dependent 2,4-dienoyl-CoA reductase/sulfur reductase-like enzyme
MMTALVAAERGHQVVLFDRADRVGGQLHLAASVPGKEEFKGLIAWFTTMLERSTVELRLGAEAAVADLAGFDRGAVEMDDAGDAAHGVVKSLGETGSAKAAKSVLTSGRSLTGTPAYSTQAWASSLPSFSRTPMRSWLSMPRRRSSHPR